MARSWLVRLVVFLSLLLPAAVWAGALDDYYLSRLAPQKSGSQLLSAVVAEQVLQAADRSLTGVRHSVRTDWKKLEPTTQAILAKVLAKPALAGEKVYSSGHFAVHYTLAAGSADALDLTLPQNALNGDGVPGWVVTVADTFENVYNVEVTVMGYQAPPVASYDVYLENLVPRRAYGFTTANNVGVTATVYPSFIEIDKAFTDTIFVNPSSGGPFTPTTSLQITAAHEFNHAIQYGYNFFFDIWYAEATATWMEDEVYDDANQLYNYLPSYMSHTSTISLNAAIDGSSEYGRWIYNRYLAEKYSPVIVRNIWKRLGTKPAPADGSDIPMLPIIDEEMVANGSSLGGEFFGFAKKLLFAQNWTSHLADVSRIYSHSLDVVGPISVSTGVSAPQPALLPYTFIYYRYIPSSSAGGLRIDFAGKQPLVAVTAFRQNQNGSVDEFPYDPADFAITVPDFPQGSQVYLLLCNNRSTAVSTPAAASSSGGGGCFIATAAYGSYLHPKVARLREFRDRFLLTNAPGRAFVRFYYRLSPPVAREIAKHAWMRAAVRVGLAPVLFSVEHPGGALLVLLLTVGGLAWGLARSRRFPSYA